MGGWYLGSLGWVLPEELAVDPIRVLAKDQPFTWRDAYINCFCKQMCFIIYSMWSGRDIMIRFWHWLVRNDCCTCIPVCTVQCTCNYFSWSAWMHNPSSPPKNLHMYEIIQNPTMYNTVVYHRNKLCKITVKYHVTKHNYCIKHPKTLNYSQDSVSLCHILKSAIMLV